jgi:hypothetical protein
MERAMELTQCPYDGTPIGNDRLPGGALLLSCCRCGAAWEQHHSMIWRVQAPDRDEVRRARAELEAVRIAASGPTEAPGGNPAA